MSKTKLTLIILGVAILITAAVIGILYATGVIAGAVWIGG